MTPDNHGQMFIAIWPSEDAVQHLLAALRSPQKSSPVWLHWQPAHRWHVTLLFLGEVSETRLKKIHAQVLDLSATISPGQTCLAGSGHFGSVLWIGLSTGDWLADLSRSLELRSLGRAPQPKARQRRFTPHLTLARSRAGHPLPEQLLTDLDAYQGPLWLPKEITLVRSTGGPMPAYTIVARYPLRADH